MKFGTFLGKVKQLLQKDSEIDLQTVKKIIKIFEDCLTNQKRERWSTELEMIKSYKSVEN